MSLADQIHALANRPGIAPEASQLLLLAAQAAAGTSPSLSTLTQHITMPKPATTNAWNPPHEPPDDTTTVLLRIDEPSEPIWPGFRLGRDWRAADGARIAESVTGWMHLEDAARLLDAATQ